MSADSESVDFNPFLPGLASAVMGERADIAAWVRWQTSQGVLQRLVEAFGDAGIRVLPVKGVVTARLLYADPAERRVGDIDVRIAPTDMRSALDVARARGWAVHSHADSPRLHEAVIMIEGWEIDVECALGPPGLCALAVEQLIARASRVGEPFPHLEPELHDHALILVLNAFKDGLRPTPWSLEDLRRIVRQEGFDGSVLVSLARAGRVLSALWIVADWLWARHGVAGWRAVRDTAGRRPPSARVAKLYGYLLAHGWPSKPALIAVAMSSDDLSRAASGLLLATAGLVKRRVSVAGGGRQEP